MTSPSFEEYLSRLPDESAKRIRSLRQLIKDLVPESEEKISYGVPTFTIKGKYFIYLAGYKNHISIYPTSEVLEKKYEEVLKYKTGSGTLQFKNDRPLPLDLIGKIIKFMSDQRTTLS